MKRKIFSSISTFVFFLCIGSFAFSQKIGLVALGERSPERDELAKGKWIEQKAKIFDYIFEVFVLSDKDDAEFSKWKGIRVSDWRSRELVQSIDASGEGAMFPLDDRLIIPIDFNFDGEMDFYIQTADGGVGPNNTADFFAFDKNAKRFILDDELSKMTQVFINSKNKTITSAYRDGCCHHHEETYAYRAGSRVLVREWDRALTADGWLEISVGKLIGKKMHYKVRRVKQKMQ